MKKEITPGVMARTDLYLDEFARFMLNFYVKDDAKKDKRLEFIEKHKEEFPRLANSNIHFRIAVRPYFDKYIYSLRNNKYPRIEIDPAPQGWLK